MMKARSDKVYEVFNSDIAKNWNKKDKKIKKIYGCDNPIKSELDPYLKDEVKLLEIGCGSGKLLDYVLDKASGCHIVGLDMSKNMLQSAKERLDKKKSAGSTVHFVVGSAESCIFKEDYFDIILLKQVLHHISDASSILKKVSCYLRENGVIILMVPGANYQKEFFSFDRHRKPDILGRFSVEGLEDEILRGNLFPVRTSIQRFVFEFDNFYDYLNFMRDIGSFQKLYNYEAEKYQPAFQLLNWYCDILSKTEKVLISGEYITCVCQKHEVWNGIF